MKEDLNFGWQSIGELVAKIMKDILADNGGK